MNTASQIKFHVNYFVPSQNGQTIFYEVMAIDHNDNQFMYQRKFDTESAAMEFIFLANEEMQCGSTLNPRVWIKWN